MAADPSGTSQPTTLWRSNEAAAAWQANAADRAEYLGPPTERMLDLACLQPGSHVLDIGAGTGDQTRLAAHRVGPTGSVLAIDVSPEMLGVAAQAAKEAGLAQVRTQVMDAQHLDLPTDAFDAVISRNGLQFMPDLVETLKGIRRVLKPGGSLAMLAWGTMERNAFFGHSRPIIRRHASVSPDPPGVPGQFALGVPEHLERALRSAEFREVAVQALPAPRHFATREAAVEAVRRNLNPNSRDAQGLAALSEDEQAAVWAEIAEEFRQFEGPDGLEMPGEILLGTGIK